MLSEVKRWLTLTNPLVLIRRWPSLPWVSSLSLLTLLCGHLRQLERNDFHCLATSPTFPRHLSESNSFTFLVLSLFHLVEPECRFIYFTFIVDLYFTPCNILNPIPPHPTPSPHPLKKFRRGKKSTFLPKKMNALLYVINVSILVHNGPFW